MERIMRVVTAILILLGIILAWVDPFRWLHGASLQYVLISLVTSVDLIQSAFTNRSPIMWLAGKLGASPDTSLDAKAERISRGIYGAIAIVIIITLMKSQVQILMPLWPLLLFFTGATGLCPVRRAVEKVVSR